MKEETLKPLSVKQTLMLLIILFLIPFSALGNSYNDTTEYYLKVSFPINDFFVLNSSAALFRQDPPDLYVIPKTTISHAGVLFCAGVGFTDNFFFEASYLWTIHQTVTLNIENGEAYFNSIAIDMVNFYVPFLTIENRFYPYVKLFGFTYYWLNFKGNKNNTINKGDLLLQGGGYEGGFGFKIPLFHQLSLNADLLIRAGGFNVKNNNVEPDPDIQYKFNACGLVICLGIIKSF